MKFSSLAMSTDVAQQKCISVKKSFFGLFTTATFKPTASKLKCEMLYYNTEHANLLLQLLHCGGKERNQVCAQHRPVQDLNGGERLDCCYSNNGSFVALQLFHYADFQFFPRTEVYYFYGTEALQILDFLNLK